MGINAQRAFHNNTTEDHYLAQLTVADHEREVLRGVRDSIRSALRAGFQNWNLVAKRDALFEHTAVALQMVTDATPLRPKFRMQGSWSYHTLNCTTYEPPQEIDLDDGMFLPVSFLSENGTVHPILVSTAYFAAVEAILRPLCDREGWALTGMPSCVRVEVRDGAHVGIGLYAIPDDQFEVLVEKADISTHSRMTFDQDMAFDDNIYAQLPSDQIMLAHREQGWKPSDPRKLEDWFQDAINRHRQQLRRVCRYLKGWRDHNWDKCRLSSIALMACVVSAYDRVSASPSPVRDDQALDMVAEQLPSMLANRIPNPVVEGQFLDEKWEDCRDEFVAAARQLSAVLKRALLAVKSEDARDLLVAELGPYMPTNAAYYVAEATGPAILREGLLRGLATEETRRAAVKLGGDDRYG